MPQMQLIASGTAAVTAKHHVATGSYATVTFSADNLATTEEVDLFVAVGGGWETLVDSSGTAVVLTATKTFATLEGGPTYAATKDETAGSCGVFVDLHPTS